MRALARSMIVQKVPQPKSTNTKSGIKKVKLVPRNKEWSMEDKTGE